jgi:hypothetical protein
VAPIAKNVVFESSFEKRMPEDAMGQRLGLAAVMFIKLHKTVGVDQPRVTAFNNDPKLLDF